MFSWTADMAFSISQGRDSNAVWLESMDRQKGFPQVKDFSEHMPLCTVTNENLISKVDVN